MFFKIYEYMKGTIVDDLLEILIKPFRIFYFYFVIKLILFLIK